MIILVLMNVEIIFMINRLFRQFLNLKVSCDDLVMKSCDDLFDQQPKTQRFSCLL